MSPEAEALRRLEDAVVDAAATKLAEAILARPQFGDVVVKAIVDEISRCAREKVAPMVDRILVERATDTFAAVDEAVNLVRDETLRAGHARVAECLPTQADVRRESLAIVRDAVAKALAPTVARIADAVTDGLAADIEPLRNTKPIQFPDPDPPSPGTPMNPAPGKPAPGTPGGVCTHKERCECYDCAVPF